MFESRQRYNSHVHGICSDLGRDITAVSMGDVRIQVEISQPCPWEMLESRQRYHSRVHGRCSNLGRDITAVSMGDVRIQVEISQPCPLEMFESRQRYHSRVHGRCSNLGRDIQPCPWEMFLDQPYILCIYMARPLWHLNRLLLLLMMIQQVQLISLTQRRLTNLTNDLSNVDQQSKIIHMEINEVTSKLTILQLVCVNSRRHLCNAYIFLKFDLFCIILGKFNIL